jgi:DNA invertase Pin-like site-specific DNA recombinase
MDRMPAAIKLEVIRRISGLHSQGYAVKAIAFTTGITPVTVRKYLRDAGLKSNRVFQPRRITIFFMLKHKTIREIATQYKVSYTTVHRFCRKNGLIECAEIPYER